MDANTVTAISATGIAVVSLAVSITEARASRRHNRYQVRPLLSFQRTRGPGRRAGIILNNRGLGPAIITGSVLQVDGEVWGSWDYETAERLRKDLPVRPHAATLRAGLALPAGQEAPLLTLPEFDYEQHAWFWDLVTTRIHLAVDYQSLYGEPFHTELSQTL